MTTSIDEDGVSTKLSAAWLEYVIDADFRRSACYRICLYLIEWLVCLCVVVVVV